MVKSLPTLPNKEKKGWAEIGHFELLGLLLYSAIIVYKGFICEDGFINLIELNNFHHGFYLSAIPDVRTQSATSPLWMLTELIIWTVFPGSLNAIIVTSISFSILAVILGLRILKKYFSGSSTFMYFLVLCGSSVFTDYSTSGLENPLIHLLLVIFIFNFFEFMKVKSFNLFCQLTFIGSTLVLTRFDLIVLIIPIFVFAAWGLKEVFSWQKFLRVTLALSPIVLWIIFSIIYYGEIFPETYYAKAKQGVPILDRIPYAILHNFRLLDFDPLAVFSIFLFLFLTVKLTKKAFQEKIFPFQIITIIPIAIGVIFYQVYFFYIGGDYMLGRFDSSSVLISAILLPCILKFASFSKLLESTFLILTITIGIYGATEPHFFVPGRDLTSTTGITRAGTFDIRRFSENWYFFRQSHLATDWQLLGFQKAVAADASIHPTSYTAISAGVIPFYSGPKSRLIDALGLTDPLIARLPCKSISIPGHCQREIPTGYENFVQSGSVSSMDKDLGVYINSLYSVKSGRVLSPTHILKTLEFAFGKDSGLLRKYEQKNQNIYYVKGSDSAILKLLFDQTILRKITNHF